MPEVAQSISKPASLADKELTTNPAAWIGDFGQIKFARQLAMRDYLQWLRKFKTASEPTVKDTIRQTLEGHMSSLMDYCMRTAADSVRHLDPTADRYKRGGFFNFEDRGRLHVLGILPFSSMRTSLRAHSIIEISIIESSLPTGSNLRAALLAHLEQINKFHTASMEKVGAALDFHDRRRLEGIELQVEAGQTADLLSAAKANFASLSFSFRDKFLANNQQNPKRKASINRRAYYLGCLADAARRAYLGTVIPFEAAL